MSQRRFAKATKVKKQIEAWRRVGLSWRDIATRLNLSRAQHGVVADYINLGREPRKTASRFALGLPAFVIILACVKCGVAHKSIKTCAPRNARRRKPFARIYEWPIRRLAKAVRGRQIYARNFSLIAGLDILITKSRAARR